MTSSLYQVALPRFPARPVFLLEDRAGGGIGVGVVRCIYGKEKSNEIKSKNRYYFDGVHHP